MSHAGSDAVFDFLRVCRHGVRFQFGLRPPADQPDPPERRFPAIHARVQAASPPPTRADQEWELGIRVKGSTENGRPLRVKDGDDSWKRRGVLYLEGIPSLDPPDPGTIVLDRWLAVPAAQASPTMMSFTSDVDQRGFLSASYPQPPVEDGRVTRVGVDYFDEYDIEWSRELPLDNWVAISFDRFWPPERDSVEYIAKVADCACRARASA